MVTPLAACVIEPNVDPETVTKLDALLADPGRWPKSIWGILNPRKLTPAARKWGAAAMGVSFLASHGFEFSKAQVIRHYRLHVPVMVTSLEDMAMIASDTPGAIPPTGALAIMDFYAKGITLGARTLELLRQRIDSYALIGELPPTELLLDVAEIGTKLATSAASLAGRGQSPMGREEDVWSGAIEGVGRPGPRLGHGRQRVVNGEARIVHDEGPKDRDAYNERARREGGTPI